MLTDYAFYLHLIITWKLKATNSFWIHTTLEGI